MADKINLYEEMNEKIADILAIEKDPSSLYASAYIKDLRAENARLKAESADKERAYNEEYNLRKDLQREWREEKEQVKKQAVKEFAEKVKEINISINLPNGILSTEEEIDDMVNDIFSQVCKGIDNLITELYGVDE